jgi:hypothetical protein
MAGMVPPEPGVYVGNEYYYYRGSAAQAVRNGNVELGVNITLNADVASAAFVTDRKIFGGTYAFDVVIDYLWADLDANLVTPLGPHPVSLGNSGIGDSIVEPVLLGWHEGNFNWNVGLLILVPTGNYSTGQLNVGRNVWAAMPQAGMTWFDPQSGLDLSALFTYVTMSKNTATDYQSGDIAQVDWAVGLHLDPQWEVGVAGNIVEQVGPDRGSGAKLGPFRAESFGVGPAVTYNAKIGRFPVSFSARWETDLVHHNTFDGDVVSVSATIVL